MGGGREHRVLDLIRLTWPCGSESAMADRRRGLQRAPPFEKGVGIGRCERMDSGARVQRGQEDGHTPHDFPIRMMCSILSTPSPGFADIFLRFSGKERRLVVTEVALDARIGPEGRSNLEVDAQGWDAKDRGSLTW